MYFRSRRSPRIAGVALALLGLSATVALAAPLPPRTTLAGHLPPAAALAGSRALGRLRAYAPVSLALTLPLRDEAGLNDFLARVSDPADPEFGQYLTPAQFADAYSPTQADYAAVAAYARSQGLSVTGVHPNRLVLDVSGPSAAVEAAFGVSLFQYQAADGRVFQAPDREPTVPAALGDKLLAVVGLENAEVWHSQARLAPDTAFSLPYQIGTGIGGGLTPSDIKTAYNVPTGPTGSGETLGLFELDGYTPSDIAAYETNFKLPTVPLTNVLVDGGSGALGSGAAEVTLDIELQIALAPGAAGVIVYEGPNTTTGVIDTYNKIATDNKATQISTSWGEAEQNETAATRTSEQVAFMQMASQGQTIYAAAGDKGAYDYRRKTLAVDDPASQPCMCGVGGTSLTTNGPGGAYVSETTWNRGSGSAGGGGISTVWSIPSYQTSVAGSAASKGSTTMRNVPDVSLDADPYTGYAIYYNGGWTIYGGTSCAAPLWAAFTALVNQQRKAANKAPLGQANPAIYSIAKSSAYAADFHDIHDGSTNLFYPAVTGYDDATGWGSFNGTNLLPGLVNF